MNMNFDGIKPSLLGYEPIIPGSYGIEGHKSILNAKLISKKRYHNVKADELSILYTLAQSNERWIIVSYDDDTQYWLGERKTISEEVAHREIRGRLKGYAIGLKHGEIAMKEKLKTICERASNAL